MWLVIIVAVAILWLASSSGAGQSDYTDSLGNDSMTVSNPLTGIANAIAQFEGYNVPGSLPNRTNNPGDIGTYGGKVSSYSTPEEGFSALQNYISDKATANPSWDFYDFFTYYLTGDPNGTPGPNQNPNEYADYVAASVGVPATTPISQVLGGG